MNNFFRYYNQNKETLWYSLLIFIIIVIVVHSIRAIIHTNNKQYEVNNVTTNTTIINKNTEKSKESSISKDKVSDENYQKQSSIIDNFINYCNAKKVNEAYELLTDECKENLFSTVEDFNNNYINTVFSTYKKYTIQNYYKNIYTIRLTEDMLSTGQSNNGEAIQDYYTIVNNKLNINEYIGREIINHSGSCNNIKITILYKDSFMGYEKYAIKVYNGSDKNIKLDSLKSTKSIYLTNSNNLQFPSYSHELIESLLIVPQGHTTELNVKFYNKYISTNEVKEMIFSDIILDYDEYLNVGNLYSNRGICKIDV